MTDIIHSKKYNMEQIIIRKAEAKDLDTLLVFEQGVINAERPFDPTLKTGHTHYYDIEKMITAPDVELVVAELDNELIGSGYARIEDAKPYLQHTQHAYLGFMYVVPQHRGKGVNKMVIDALAAWSASQHITELRLDVYQQNEAAIKAYERCGFTKHMVAMRMGLK
jgi:RimJ/RimL family protein N-acetyltransferase